MYKEFIHIIVIAMWECIIESSQKVSWNGKGFDC
jgi:hypothetical protein